MYGSLIGRKHRPQTVGVIVVSSFGMWHVVNVVAVTDMPGIRTVSAEMFGLTSIGSDGGGFSVWIKCKIKYEWMFCGKATWRCFLLCSKLGRLHRFWTHTHTYTQRPVLMLLDICLEAISDVPTARLIRIHQRNILCSLNFNDSSNVQHSFDWAN